MKLSNETKQQVNKLIFERAYEIEQQLSEDNFFTAKILGIKPEMVSDVSLKVAVKELKKEWAKG